MPLRSCFVRHCLDFQKNSLLDILKRSPLDVFDLDKTVIRYLKDVFWPTGIATDTFPVFTIFVSISKRRSISVLSMWSIFHFHLHFHRHTSSFAYFLEYVLLFLDENVNEKCQQFSNNKISVSGCCLVFAWFLPI